MSSVKAIINSSQLLTMNPNVGSTAPLKGTKVLNSNYSNKLVGIIQQGALLIEDGTIVFVGTTEEVKQHVLFQRCDDVIDAEGGVVMPGYIDSHTHFVFGGDRSEEYNLRLAGADYMEILEKGGGINNSVESTRFTNFEKLVEIGMNHLDGMFSYGVTTVEGKSGYGLNLETEIKQLQVMKELNCLHPIDVVSTYLGAHSVPKEWKGREDQLIDALINEQLPVIKAEELAVFCDVFCEKGVFDLEQSRKLLKAAQNYGFKLKIHADEIVNLGGGGLAAEVKAVSADHLLAVSEESLLRMKEEDVVATLLPITAFSLREHYAPARKMLDLGLTVALATDYNPGSCPSYSIPLVIALATLNMGMTIEEVLTALTINGAKALSLETSLGSLEVGKQADVIIHHVDNYKKIPYHLGMNTISKVIKKGEIYVN